MNASWFGATFSNPASDESLRQAREIARLPIGARVVVRGCPGLGVGIVREHVTSEGGIPLRGWLKVRVELDGLDEGRSYRYLDTFAARELAVSP